LYGGNCRTQPATNVSTESSSSPLRRGHTAFVFNHDDLSERAYNKGLRVASVKVDIDRLFAYRSDLITGFKSGWKILLLSDFKKKMAIATHPFIQADETSSNNHLIVQFDSAMSELLSSAQHCSAEEGKVR
jgi:hypothetical protein